jgi:putative ABC transport system permease protein
VSERAGGSPLPPELEALIRAVLDASGLGLPARAEVEADLRAHFEDGLEAGVSWRDLRDRFGDPAQAGTRIARARREAGPGRGTSDGRWWMSATDWWAEVKRSVRRLARAPGFAAVVVLTLALGVGANTAIFTVVDAVLLRPLPYAHPDRLVRVYESDPDDPDNSNYLRGPTVAAYRTWTDVFDGFGALYVYRETGADLTDGATTVRVTTVPVSAGYFETLGVAPLLGRTFREEESVAPGEPGEGATRGDPLARVAVLSHGLWVDRFGGARDVLGRTILLDDRSYQVVGVMPKGFSDPFGPRADLWTPQDLRIGGRNNWGNYYLSAVARLRPGLTVAAAQERVDALYARLLEEHPEAGSNWVPTLAPLHRDLVGPTRRTMLLILAGAAALVLLTACVNLANLLFARGLGRDRDVAVRAALGSGRGRIVAGLLVETGVLALAGGAVGLALGWVGVRALLALSPDALPTLIHPQVGWSVFGFTLVVTLVALVMAGLTPALRLAGTPPADALRSDGRTTTGGRRVRRVRDLLAVAQVAAALILVAGAALLGKSFATLAGVPLVVDTGGVLTFEVNLPGARYPTGGDREAFHRTFHQRVVALPEVAWAGAVSWLPVSGRFNIWSAYWDPEHPDGSNDEAWYSSDIRVISGDYFRSLGIDVPRGPEPTEVDYEGERVVWVNQRFAREVFGDGDAIGRILGVGGEARRVVGVVEDVPFDAEGDVSRKVYIPHAQFADDRNWTLTQTVKVRGDPTAALERIRSVLAGLDGQLVLYRPRRLADVVGSARAQNRFATVLMGAFAVLALLLSLVGTYGVLAGTVAGRTREFGIRMALGADRRSVRALVLRHSAGLVLPGVALGLAGAWIGGRWLRSLLFRVEPRDPVVLALAVVVFLAVGLLSGWLPARRATRVDPARTLSVD